MPLIVQGIHCKSCVMLIEEELEDLGATNINISFNAETQKGVVDFTGISEDDAKKVIEELGEYTIL